MSTTITWLLTNSPNDYLERILSKRIYDLFKLKFQTNHRVQLHKKIWVFLQSSKSNIAIRILDYLKKDWLHRTKGREAPELLYMSELDAFYKCLIHEFDIEQPYECLMLKQSYQTTIDDLYEYEFI